MQKSLQGTLTEEDKCRIRSCDVEKIIFLLYEKIGPYKGAIYVYKKSQCCAGQRAAASL